MLNLFANNKLKASNPAPCTDNLLNPGIDMVVSGLAWN